jgi:hypothetical protein
MSLVIVISTERIQFSRARQEVLRGTVAGKYKKTNRNVKETGST